MLDKVIGRKSILYYIILYTCVKEQKPYFNLVRFYPLFPIGSGAKER